MADIYIPEELDPLNPNLDNSESKAGNLNPENPDNISKSAKKRKKKKDKKNKNKGENSKNEVINEPNYQETKTPEVSVDDLRNQEEPPEPPVSITFFKDFFQKDLHFLLTKDLFLFQLIQVFFKNYEQNSCVSSSFLNEKMPFHMSHICDLFEQYELH